MNSHLRIEVCANSVASAIEAQKGGAYRVELCAGMPEGGTTPSYGEIAQTRSSIDIKLNVIIRPRGGDFLYSRQEIEVMKSDIQMASSLGADGVVFGCLTKDGDVDVELCQELLACAQGMSTTFHRAFDMCNDPFQALEDIINLGFDRILTSGGEPTAYEGRMVLKELVRQANGRIVIMPGCGVSASNIKELRDLISASEFHLSGRERVESSMVFRKSRVSMGGPVLIDEFAYDQTSAEKIKAVLREL